MWLFKRKKDSAKQELESALEESKIDLQAVDSLFKHTFKQKLKILSKTFQLVNSLDSVREKKKHFDLIDYLVRRDQEYQTAFLQLDLQLIYSEMKTEKDKIILAKLCKGFHKCFDSPGFKERYNQCKLMIFASTPEQDIQKVSLNNNEIECDSRFESSDTVVPVKQNQQPRKNKYKVEDPYNIESYTELEALFQAFKGKKRSFVVDEISISIFDIVSIDVSYHQFPKLPKEIGVLLNLTELNLLRMDIQGKIPSSIGNLTQLTYLSLCFNKLEGEIPESLSQLVKLYHLDLSNNRLSGYIPASLSLLKELKFLNLSGNNFVGDIPLQLVELEQAQKMNSFQISFQYK